ncbi:hypothetical protein N0V95_002508 [Ascochyta clinopodiicola]|nr:hypothetical protein N0V95_002508 [Ascochyta clinopodiicola]
MVHSYKDLPLRLYQTGRKYRDERRPRQGLLRAKEFMMKDLYTFDSTVEAGLETYKSVRQAYKNLFDELKLPYLVADADSGNMGGKLSHEYHFVSPKGEDNVWSCDSCEYVANEELVEKKPPSAAPADAKPLTFTGISTDRKTRIEIHVPHPSDLAADATPTWDQISTYTNLHALKKAVPSPTELDTGIESGTLTPLLANTTSTATITDASLSPSPTATDLTITREGDACPHCATGHLHVQKAIEVGHTFHLGTRYSEPLHAYIAGPDSATTWSPMQMGCHGIGVSRLIGAIAALLSDARGLQWPRAVAPFEVAVLAGPQVDDGAAAQVYDAVGKAGAGGVDVVLDDRAGKGLGWKMKDADLIGYPVVVVMGRGWKDKGEVEVQCRRLGVKKDVGVDALKSEVEGLLAQL